MKTLGLIGGMSWESTLPYYRHINELVRERLGGLHSAKLVLCSVDFHEIEVLQREARWDDAGAMLAQAARSLAAAGADCVVLCTNTMHKVADAIEAAVELPLLHIADATAAEITRSRFSRVGLLGTRFTMEQDFYRKRLEDRHGIEVLVPDDAGRDDVHRIIYDELCRGIVRDPSRERYRAIIASLVDRGAQAIVLGCTEIGLLVGAVDAFVPLFDTTRIHAADAVRFALE
jgi:aspartate racemase